MLDMPWTRATPPGATVAVGYVTIRNTGEYAARFVGGSAPLAGSVEIHEMTMTDGVVRMRPFVDGLRGCEGMGRRR